MGVYEYALKSRKAFQKKVFLKGQQVDLSTYKFAFKYWSGWDSDKSNEEAFRVHCQKTVDTWEKKRTSVPAFAVHVHGDKEKSLKLKDKMIVDATFTISNSWVGNNPDLEKPFKLGFFHTTYTDTPDGMPMVGELRQISARKFEIVPLSSKIVGTKADFPKHFYTNQQDSDIAVSVSGYGVKFFKTKENALEYIKNRDEFYQKLFDWYADQVLSGKIQQYWDDFRASQAEWDRKQQYGY